MKSWVPAKARCRGRVIAGLRDVNVGAPDLDAFYYASSISPLAGTQAVISGEYPAARYFSFVLYNASGT